MASPYQSDLWYVSPYNFYPDVRGAMRLPEKVVLNDLTLREGRQIEGVAVTIAEMQTIARLLEEARVPMLQLHYTPEELEPISRLGLKMRTEVLISCPYQRPPFTLEAHRERMDLTMQLGLGLDLCFGTSDQLLLGRRALRPGSEPVADLRRRELEAALQAVSYAKSQGATVGVNLQDFLRAEPDFLYVLCKELAELEIDTITLDDFAAPAIPAAYKYVFSWLTSSFPRTQFGIHVTNDSGLASAVVLGALEGGAQVLDVGVNGYGERGGHADLAAVAIALKVFYGIDPGVDLHRLYALSHEVARIMGLRVPMTAALVGDNAFADVTDTHYLYEGHPWVYRVVSPSLVGNRRRIGLAGVSGPLVIRAKAAELGMNLPQDAEEPLAQRVIAELQSRKAPLTDPELISLAQEVSRGI